MSYKVNASKRLALMAAVLLASRATQVEAAPTDAQLDKALKLARAKVNSLTFGTPEWETAMEEVRKLVDQKNAGTDFGKHTSRDGNVLSSVQAASEGGKYKLSEEHRIGVGGSKLWQIEATKDFGNVKAGEKGGWIKSEANLSHAGNCWIGEDAMVYDDAEVSGDAYVHGHARVFDHAKVSDKAHVMDMASIYGKARVSGDAHVFGHAHVYDNAEVYRKAQVYDSSRVFDHARVFGLARVYGRSRIYGRAEVYDNQSYHDEVIDK